MAPTAKVAIISLTYSRSLIRLIRKRGRPAMFESAIFILLLPDVDIDISTVFSASLSFNFYLPQD
jgi:hypothetical protein